MKSSYALALVALLACASDTAHAVYLNPRGMGQVLVYPYYTANGNNSTLLAIVNTTGNGKALKVRFHEGYDGRGVLDFNIYLSPFATWTGQVVDRIGSATAQASIITHDSSCTVPAFASLQGSASTRFLDFSGASYAGTVTATGVTGNSDGGPLGLDRTREGHFDVLEMGEITNTSHASLSAITQTSGVPANCAQIVDAWASGGYWAADSHADMSPPTGGIYGSEGIIDVAQGTLFTVNPETIDGFSTSIQHTAPGAAIPDLNTASRSDVGTVGAFVAVNGKMLDLEYQNPVDAISALFMTDSLYNEFNSDPGMGALSDWVVTAPTKRYYVDPAYIGSAFFTAATAPFDVGFLFSVVSGNGGGFSSFPYACVQIDPWSYDRSGAGNQDVIFVGGGTQGDGLLSDPALVPCLETSVLTFSTQFPAGSNVPVPQSALDSHLTNFTDPYSQVINGIGVNGSHPPPVGVLHLDLAHDRHGNGVNQHRLTAAANGDVLVGLPVFGFLAVNYVNENVTPGVLANYSGLNPHRTSVSCRNSAGPDGGCL